MPPISPVKKAFIHKKLFSEKTCMLCSISRDRFVVFSLRDLSLRDLSLVDSSEIIRRLVSETFPPLKNNTPLSHKFWSPNNPIKDCHIPSPPHCRS